MWDYLDSYSLQGRKHNTVYSIDILDYMALLPEDHPTVIRVGNILNKLYKEYLRGNTVH